MSENFIVFRPLSMMMMYLQEQQPCLYQRDDHQLHPGDRQSSSPIRCFPDN